ncbi:hypothetical protein ACDQ55_16095 [Chitinophaga sp. 30R24]|uniref:hypothetical protein n=1 Tax=Chitinophaga sp. 30R24 TaxID=3248838 RepID=UPI003B9062B0
MKVKKQKKGPFTILVNETDNILLTVTIGNAQIGGNIVLLEDTQLFKGEVKNGNLGIGGDLVGKKLTVTTNVLDVNPDSNKVSITHFFYNGQPPVFSYPAVGEEMEVDNDGDIYSLTATYVFNKK